MLIIELTLAIEPLHEKQMNNSISRTNQKLYFAKLTLGQITSDQPKIANALREAQHEACLFHLHGAYLAFLQEIADQYQINTQPQSLMELILEFKQQKNFQINEKVIPRLLLACKRNFPVWTKWKNCRYGA